jgi:signal peptidase II
MLPLLVAIVIVIADQLTKEWVRTTYEFERLYPVIRGFFDLTYVRNTGAAWGMFGGQNVGLTALSIVMLVLLVIFRRKFLGDTWDHRLALGLLIGGIVGNLLDRIRLNFVTDFLYFHAGNHYFPAFNVADSAICCGVGIYMLSSLWPSRRHQHPGPDSKSAAKTA